MNKENKNKVISTKELVWYLIAGFIAFLGVVSIIFGIIGHHYNGPLEDNFIKQAEKVIVLDFRTWGIIAVAIGIIIAIITLSVFAKEYDRTVEKSIRRQQRQTVTLPESDMEIRPAVQTVDIESMVRPATEESNQNPEETK